MILIVLFATLLCGSLFAQAAPKITYFGAPCRDQAGKVLLLWAQIPTSGGALAALVLDGSGSQFPTGRRALILFGSSATKWGPIRLPLQPNRLPFLPGCSLYTSPDIIVATWIINYKGLPRGHQVRVPHVAGLKGKTVYVQGLVPILHRQRGLLVAFSDAASVKF